MTTSIKIDDELKACEAARESFKQEAITSWAAYQETGLHLSGQEVRNWLNTWGSKTEAELPLCHE